MKNQTASFYFVGGTMRGDARSYIERQADADLYNGLMSGRFCYVLTSRQMGKSSLVARTAVRLKSSGVTSIALDLTGVGQNVTVEQWYEGLLSEMGESLGREVEAALENFWERHQRLGPLQRWKRAIREVVLEHFKSPVVIFIDEIDAVRSLPFSTDEFFAGIREFYNRRTQDPELERLTFCLLGVATPSDLIRDTRMTPFNIGRRVELRDFTDEEAAPLAAGLGRDDATNAALLRRVLYWTGGHPYLTQRLCRTVAEDPTVKSVAGVDRVCKKLFMSRGAMESEENLRFVRDRVLMSDGASRARLLDLYLRVDRGRPVTDDNTNPDVSALKLSGITRVIGNRLHVRNRIYHSAFDRAWVAENMPDAEKRARQAAYRKGLLRAAAVAAGIILAVASLAWWAITQKNQADRTARALQETQAQLEKALSEARTNAFRAEENSREVTAQRTFAEQKRTEADDQLKVAQEQRRVAQKKEQEAREAATRARRSEQDAYRQKQIALQSQRETQAALEQRTTALESQTEAEQRANKSAKLAEEARKGEEEQGRLARKSAEYLRRDSMSTRHLELSSANIIVEMANRLFETTDKTESLYWRKLAGELLSRIGAHHAAIAEYNKVLAIDDSYPAALFSRSYVYNIIGDPAAGARDAEKYLTIIPNSAFAYVNLGYSQGGLKQYEKARQSFRTAIREMIPGTGVWAQTAVTPEISRVTRRPWLLADTATLKTALYFEVANLHAYEGGTDFERTLKEADAEVEAEEARAAAASTRPRPPAVVPAAQGAYVYALNWAYMHLKKNPEDYGAWAGVGVLWRRADYRQQATDAYARFRCEHRLRADARYADLAAWVEGELKDLEAPDAPCPDQLLAGGQDEEEYDAQAVMLEAEEVITRFMHEGNLSLPLGGGEPAPADGAPGASERKRYLEPLEPKFKKALEEDGSNVPLWLKLADLYLWEEKYDEAEAVCDKIIELFPRAPEAWVYRALARKERGKGDDRSKAEADLRKAIELDPSNAVSVFSLAELLVSSKQKEALALFRRSTKLGLDHLRLAYAHAYQGLLMNNQCCHDEALDAAKMALTIRPMEMSFYDLRAMIRSSMGVEQKKIRAELLEGYLGSVRLQAEREMPATSQEYRTRIRYLLTFKPTPGELAALSAKISEAIASKRPKENSERRALEFWREALKDEAFGGNDEFIRKEIARLTDLGKR